MAYIDTIENDQAQGAVRHMYRQQQGSGNFVPNYARAFCHRPSIMSAWASLLQEIRKPVERRRYLLVSLAAAQELRSSYCALAFGTRLLKSGYTSEQLLELITDIESGTLNRSDKAIMQFARQIVRDSASITAEDIGQLRALGLVDAEIFDIVVVAAARCFFARIPDSLGFNPDSEYHQLDEHLKRALVVGRPIAEATEIPVEQ